MKMKKPKRKKVYRLSDLVDIAEQLGCRVRFELLPREAFTIKDAPEKPQPKSRKG